MSRNSANGSTRMWLKLRGDKLAHDPLCEWRETSGERCLRSAGEVDHIIPLKEWPVGRYVWSNLRSLCSDHHKIRHGKRPRPSVDPKTGLPTANHWWAE